ncbi:hypothetical protein [Sphingomonas montana]|uniref:hypothetical protein n=1 Tax=Sphingomonas montana TaxID=1843236 RepID=UPI00101ADBB0|nr:hypothetical protein [Sphingomonas montana]
MTDTARYYRASIRDRGPGHRPEWRWEGVLVDFHDPSGFTGSWAPDRETLLLKLRREVVEARAWFLERGYKIPAPVSLADVDDDHSAILLSGDQP